MSEFVPEQSPLWSREERHRIREKYRNKETLSREELLVYKRDRQLRKEKHEREKTRQQQQQPAAAATSSSTSPQPVSSSTPVPASNIPPHLEYSQPNPEEARTHLQPDRTVNAPQGYGEKAQFGISVQSESSPRTEVRLSVSFPAAAATESTSTHVQPISTITELFGDLEMETVKRTRETLQREKAESDRRTRENFQKVAIMEKTRQQLIEKNRAEEESLLEQLKQREALKNKAVAPFIAVEDAENKRQTIRLGDVEGLRKRAISPFMSSAASEQSEIVMQLLDELSKLQEGSFKPASEEEDEEEILSKRAEMNACALCIYDCKRRYRQHRERRRDPNPVWRNSIKEIDGRFGSSITVFFTFMRWLFLLNLLLSVFWLGLVIIPQLTSFNYANWPNISQAFSTLAGSTLYVTWFYYTGYSQTVGTYLMDIAYAMTVAATYLLSLIFTIRELRHYFLRGGSVSLVRKSGKIPFSSAVFNGWDYTIRDESTAAILRNGLALSLKELVQEDALSNRIRNRLTRGQRCALYTRRTLSWFFTLCIYGGSVTAVYFLVLYQTSVEQFFTYTISFAVALINGIGPVIMKALSFMDGWRSERTRIVTAIGRIYVLKMGNILFLLFQLYTTTSTNACGVDNAVASQFWQLIVIDFIVAMAVTIFVELAFFLLFKCRGLGRVEYDIPGNVIEIIYRQALIWIGMIWIPWAPIGGALATFILFYTKKWMAFAVHQPAERPWDATKSGSFFFGLITFTLIIAAAPLTYFFVRYRDTTSSSECGPFKSYTYTYEVFAQYVLQLPSWLYDIFFWAFSNVVLLVLAVILCFVIYFCRGRADYYRREFKDTQRELRFESRERQKLVTTLRNTLNRLSPMFQTDVSTRSSPRSTEV